MKVVSRLEEIEKEIRLLIPIVDVGDIMFLKGEKQGIILTLGYIKREFYRHRKEAKVTCGDNCFCWNMDLFLLNLEKSK